MSNNKPCLEPPSYSDSVYPTFSGGSLDSITRLSQNRTLHINATIERFIAPIVNSRLSHGLNFTTIALIPIPKNILNTPSVDHDFKTTLSEIIGLASDHNLDAQFEMTTAMDSKEFWMQTKVITELEQNMKQKWCSSTAQCEDQIFGEKAEITRIPTTIPQTHIASEARPTSLLSRLSSRQPKFEMMDSPSPKKIEFAQRDVVKVKLDELCFRTINAFGLYETTVKPAVIISIDITH